MTRLLFVIILGLAGCATISSDSEEQPIANGEAIARAVELCKTTIADLQAQLGEPSRDGVLGTSRILTWVVAWDPLVKYLGVLADQQGTVVDVYWNLPSEVQWSPTNRCQ